MLPREWTRKTQAPVWKAAAIAGWAFSLILAQCLVIVLAWPGLTRPAPPPPPPPEPAPAVLPAPLPPGHNGAEIQVSNSLARVRCLVNVGRSQEALAETIRCLTLCQRAQIDPPADLPALFAQTVTHLSNRTEHSFPRPTPRPSVAAQPPAPTLPEVEDTPPMCGRVPGCAYPLAHRPHPKLAKDDLAQLPDAPPPMLPPAPAATSSDGPQPGPYPFQPNRRPQGPPPGGGFPPPPPGF
jgi:hypothetical protein